jgi:ATP-dependent Lon protease
VSKDKEKKVLVTPKNLDKYLGVRRFTYGIAEKKNQVGQVTGLAWTEVGGELLTIEAVTMPGKGKTITTGKLGEVMQESIQAALSVVRNRSSRLGVPEDFYQKNDIHVHLPEGATPKDGPSAGIGICTAMVSVLTGIPVRADVAMTGEITLRGRVLPIGGLKEKLLAALRTGLKTVIIPSENEKDLADIPDNVKKGLEIVPVANMEEVLKIALVRAPIPVVWEEPEEPPASRRAEDGAEDAVVTH